MEDSGVGVKSLDPQHWPFSFFFFGRESGHRSLQPAGNKRAVVLIKLCCMVLILNTGLVSRFPLTPRLFKRSYSLSSLASAKKPPKLSVRSAYLSCEWRCPCTFYPERCANAHKSGANTFGTSCRVDCGFTLVKGQREWWRRSERGNSRSPGWSVFCHLERCLLSPSVGSPPFIAPTSLGSILGFHRGPGEDVRVSTLAKLKAKAEIHSAAISLCTPSTSASFHNLHHKWWRWQLSLGCWNCD